MEEKRAFLFVNGDLDDNAFLLKILKQEDYLVAVDGGLRHLLALDRFPHILIGDLDSVQAADLDAVQNKAIPILHLDIRKDVTDLEAALQHVIDAGYSRIQIVAGWGDRMDHSLSNLLVLTKPDWREVDIRLVDENMEAYLVKSGVEIHGNRGDLISLIPLDEEVTKVTSQGLEYPLTNESLFRWNARGVSNVMLSSQAMIHFQSGDLLCVHIFNPKKILKEDLNEK